MTILTVTQINKYIKSVFDSDNNLKQLYITGEISNYKPHYSGHHYFTLKDESSEIKAVMFASSASRLRFKLENGMKIIVRGRISVYDVKGTYQLYCDDIQPDGIGALTIAYEQLKRKLENEGLFDRSYKKNITAYPEKIGVITAPTGAAVQDIFSILERRFPYAEVYFVPVAVQGESAAPQITKAIELLNNKTDCDFMIIGRGGGSIEDLWAFNEEIVARAIFASKIPVISAVGHETDFTIADFVADIRAATPSAAAEIGTPDTQDLLLSFDSFSTELNKKILGKITEKEYQVQKLASIIREKSPLNVVNERINQVNNLRLKMEVGINQLVSTYDFKLKESISKIESCNPMKILSKGYNIAKNNDGLITSVSQIKSGDDFELVLSDGSLSCKVN